MAGKEASNKIVAAVRIRGRVGVRSATAETLSRLRLGKPNNCAIIKTTDAYSGMLKKCSNYIAYGEIDEATLERLLKRHAADVDAKKVLDGSYPLADLRKSMPFRLHPPKHGYRRNTRMGYAQGGELGYVGTAINGLIARMV